MTSRRLEADGLSPLELNASNGFRLPELDLGFPQPREVMFDRPDADGVDDVTAHHGGRVVSMRLLVRPGSPGSLQATVDRLAAFCRPGLRPWLYYRLDDADTERRIRLRASMLSRPLTDPTHQTVQVQWAAPDGVQEAATETTSVADATVDQEAGITFDLAFPVDFPESSPIGTVNVTNAGNANAYPVLRLYGPCTNPRIENQTAGRTLEFDNLTIADGDYLEINTRDRTVLLNGDATQGRYDRLDFAASSWWTLAPGVNVVRFYPETFDAGCEAHIVFRSAWL